MQTLNGTNGQLSTVNGQSTERPRALFTLGRIMATPGAIATMEHDPELWVKLISRHVTGDWEEMEEEDQYLNKLAVAHGTRIFSRYTLDSGKRIWVITEADRSATTLLRPEEY